MEAMIMKTRVGISHEPKRKRPWLVYWFGEPDPETCRQRKHTKCFRYNREARSFQATKQAELDQGGPRDRPADVTLGRLLKDFWEARIRHLSHKSHLGYQATFQLLHKHFGGEHLIRHVKGRHAEGFMAGLRRKDGRSDPLSTWTKLQRVISVGSLLAAGPWLCVDGGYHGAMSAFPPRFRPKR